MDRMDALVYFIFEMLCICTPWVAVAACAFGILFLVLVFVLLRLLSHLDREEEAQEKARVYDKKEL